LKIEVKKKIDVIFDCRGAIKDAGRGIAAHKREETFKSRIADDAKIRLNHAVSARS
jgi:hypothetical protein